jgi:hypothetical protein
VTKIIISYRRSDSDVFAGRVCDRVAKSFGEESVFIDVDNIPFGKDFRVHIQEAMAEADAVLVVIGPQWLGAGRTGQSRIMEDNDPVRIEVETALNKRIATIPVLVGRTNMPQPEELPDSLRDFAFINAASVDTGRDFHRDLNRVIAAISTIIARPPLDRIAEYERTRTGSVAVPAPIKPQQRGLPGPILAIAASVIVMAVLIGGFGYWIKTGETPVAPQPEQNSTHASNASADEARKPAPTRVPVQTQEFVIAKSAPFGGNGGSAFDDTDWNANRLPISALNIIVNLNPADNTERIIGGVQAQWADKIGPLHGGKGPFAQPATVARFDKDEKIGRVDINTKTYHFPTTNEPPKWIAGLAIWTDARVYSFGDMTFGPTHQCILAYGEILLGFFGRSGSYIDQIGCITGKPK